MRPRLPSLLPGLLLAGCAAAGFREEPAPAPEPPVPDLLAGLPAAVVVERALVELDSGDPQRAGRARSILFAVPDGPALEPLRERARAAAKGSAARLDALAVLVERGEPLDRFDRADVLEMSLREIDRREPSGRSLLLALDRLRGLGEDARAALRAETLAGGPRAPLASRVLALLFSENLSASGTRP